MSHDEDHIAARRRAEAELAKQQLLLRAIVDNSAAVIFVKDLEGRYLMINRRYAELFGVDAETVRGRTDYDIFPRETADAVREADRQTLAAGCAREFEEVVPQDDGAHTYLSQKFPLYDASGKAYAVCGIATDITERKRSEETLRRSEAQLKEAQEIARVGSWELDIAHDVLIWSDEVYKLFEIDPGRFSASYGAFLDAIHPEDREAVNLAYARSVAEKQPYEIAHRLLMRDGRIKYVTERGQTHYADDGRPLRSVGTVQDITEQRLAEMALRESLHRAEFLADLIDRSALPLAGGYPDGRVGMVNKAFCRLTGYTKEELASIDWNGALTPPEWRALEAEKLVELVRTGQAVRYEKEYLRKDGSRVPVELLTDVRFGEDGQPSYFYASITDITERKRAEEKAQRLNLELERRVAERTAELAESEARFRAFMAHSPAAAWIVDADGRFHYVNPVYCQMFGIGETDLLGAVQMDLTGKRIAEIFPEPLARLHTREHVAVLERGQVVEGIRSGLRADGEPGEFLVVKFPIRGADNHPLVCCIALDVTEQRQMMAHLRAANQRLSGIAAERAAHLRELAGELIRAEQRERDGLYELLHDHVQPLLVATRFALARLERAELPEVWRRTAHDALGHITAAIDTARSLSVELNPPVVRDRGLAEALDWLRRRIDSTHGLTVDLEFSPEVEPADAEVRLLCFKAVRELLMNVVKHADTPYASISVAPHTEETLSITVEDRGRGFDAAAVRAAADGSGLASIERRLGMIGGHLNIESTTGGATRVTLFAPRKSAAARGAARAHAGLS